MTEITQGFIYDYKQLDYFHIDPDKVSSSWTIVNEPYWEKYKYLFILLYPSILALLIASIVWLMRANRRESKRRIQAQTRLLVQNKLVEQRNEFDNVFHSIRDGVITYDTDLHIHFTNRSLLQMLHLPYESGGRFYEGMMAGSIFKIYYNGQDILHSMLKQVAAKGESVKIPQGAFMKEVHSDSNTRLNFRQRNVNGEYEWWEYRSSVITGLTQDSLYNILGVCQSIQRYKTAEQEMREARDKALQADKLKSAFLANMSHEIRTPLNAIVGFSDLLSDTSGFTSEEIAQFIGTINKNCGLLLALINDILDLSRIESGTMEFMFAEHNLPLLLKTVHDSQRLNMPPGVELVLRMPESDKKYLTTDNVRLQQVVNNLINNAAKFTSSGFITFGYEDDEVPGYTRIFVEDTGVGISEEGIRHIFERFYKVDNFTQGAGLGLSICQTIIERLNGTISVTSEVGKGTRFTVRLPNYCE